LDFIISEDATTERKAIIKCMFGSAVTRIDFDRIDFVKIDFGQN
jgi:hypothetical protein